MAWKDDYSWRQEQGGPYADAPVGTQMGIGSFLRQNPGDTSRIPNISFMESGGEDWGDYGQWQGVSWDPLQLPDYIDWPTTDNSGGGDDGEGGNWWDDSQWAQPSSDYDWSLGFRPTDMDPTWLKPGTEQGLPGLAESGVNWREWNDADWASHFGDFPEVGPLGGSGLVPAMSNPGILGALEEAGHFTYGLDPQDTQNQAEGYPDYNIYRGGNITPYALRRAAADDGPGPNTGACDPGYHRDPAGNCVPDGPTPPTTITTFPEEEKDFNPLVETDVKFPYEGEVWETPQTVEYPFSVPQMQTIGNVQVGDDPMSEMVNANIASLLATGGVAPTPLAGQTEGALSTILGQGGEGGTAESLFGGQIQSELQDLLANAGALEADPQRQAMQLEQARVPIDALRQAQMAEGQRALASRNLLGQGPEIDFMERLEGRLAPAYAAAGQQIALNEQENADQRYMAAVAQGGNMAAAQAQRREERLIPALSLATGMSEMESQNLLATVGTWTERQEMLSQIALQNLDRNMDWSQFLAEFGLERDQVIEMMQQGRVDLVINALNNNMTAVQSIAQGFVPYGRRYTGE